jgi:hypothetical protein
MPHDVVCPATSSDGLRATPRPTVDRRVRDVPHARCGMLRTSLCSFDMPRTSGVCPCLADMPQTIVVCPCPVVSCGESKSRLALSPHLHLLHMHRCPRAAASLRRTQNGDRYAAPPWSVSLPRASSARLQELRHIPVKRLLEPLPRGMRRTCRSRASAPSCSSCRPNQLFLLFANVKSEATSGTADRSLCSA